MSDEHEEEGAEIREWQEVEAEKPPERTIPDRRDFTKWKEIQASLEARRERHRHGQYRDE